MRRLLTEAEQERVGASIDIRRTDLADARFVALLDAVPAVAREAVFKWGPI